MRRRHINTAGRKMAAYNFKEAKMKVAKNSENTPIAKKKKIAPGNARWKEELRERMPVKKKGDNGRRQLR